MARTHIRCFLIGDLEREMKPTRRLKKRGVRRRKD
jgi:hypothetical protein